MHLEITDLHFFRTVVEAGGITAAAGRLHCVPSNVSARIRLAEERLGVKLFRRENRRLTLLPEGRQLLGYAERILNLAAEAEQSLQAKTPQGVLRLGATDCATAGFLPAPLATYQRENSASSVQLQGGHTRSLTRAVAEGEIEAAVVVDAATDPRLEHVVLGREALVWITRRDAALIRRVEDMGQVTLLGFPDGCAYRARAERWFASRKAAPARVIELNSYHVLLACVAAGMGVALVPESLVKASPAGAQLRCHPLAKAEATATVGLVCRRGPRSARVTRLLEILKR